MMGAKTNLQLNSASSEITTKLPYAAASSEATTKLPYAAASSEATTKLPYGKGVWMSISEYARSTGLSRDTFLRWIKRGESPHPFRRSIKVAGQRGSGYELYTEDQKIIDTVLTIRRIKAAGLDEREQKKKNTIICQTQFNVDSGIYLAERELKNKISFDSYLSLALSKGANLIRSHKQISVRIHQQNHATIVAQARKAGISIMEAYKTLYEQYVTSLYNSIQ